MAFGAFCIFGVYGFQCGVVLFAGFSDCVEYGVVPVLWVVDEHDGFGFGSSDIVRCLFGHVFNGFFV